MNAEGQRLSHLLDFSGWDEAGVRRIFETADAMAEVLKRPIKKVPTLQGRTVATVFFEPSTRTRTSFELAARRLSADVVSFSPGTSSLKKGESYKDTLLTLAAYGVDLFVIRADAAGVPAQATRWVRASVVNAGDGRRAHPTQALLDAYTLEQVIGPLRGKKIAIVGDILHSRVARSDAELFSLLGAEVWLSGPPSLLPKTPFFGARMTPDLKEALDEADAVIALRIQKERMEGGLLPSEEEYRASYQINEATLALAKPTAPLLHPGPMNRDLEVDGRLADGPRSLVLHQVENGLAIRMAVLYHCLVGGGEA